MGLGDEAATAELAEVAVRLLRPRATAEPRSVRRWIVLVILSIYGEGVAVPAAPSGWSKLPSAVMLVRVAGLAVDLRLRVLLMARAARNAFTPVGRIVGVERVLRGRCDQLLHGAVALQAGVVGRNVRRIGAVTACAIERLVGLREHFAGVRRLGDRRRSEKGRYGPNDETRHRGSKDGHDCFLVSFRFGVEVRLWPQFPGRRSSRR